MPRRHRAREFGGVTILVAGIAIGSLGTVLWQGAQTPAGFGAGIRSMLDSFRAPPAGEAGRAKNAAENAAPNAEPSTNFDFYTTLPGIEVLVPPSTPDEPPPPRSSPGGNYMLQAAAYSDFGEADRLKARLALAGLKSRIQKVSIQGSGDFYRVRLGPYATFAQMEAARTQLNKAGIKDALGLKVKSR
ncbi:MAG: SPOR domain-containing protein [Gammaproteobacteria bacterium]|nr:SPOR domain-containing protein [Gammaproteobacteria bacterium]